MAFVSFEKKQIFIFLLLWLGAESARPRPRIVGGNFAHEGQFPHQVSLLVNNRHHCGGSIISERYVITAAHCVTNGNPPQPIPLDILEVRAGSTSYNSGGQLVGVEELKVHPSFNEFDNDIALIKLAESLEMNEDVASIPLATQNPPSGVNVSTSGWGRTSYDGPLSTRLKFNTLVSLDRRDCSLWAADYVPEKVFCVVGSAANGVCRGDSGGPAVYQNELVGVTNYVQGGCGYYPDGFASVAEHLDWLRENSRD